MGIPLAPSLAPGLTALGGGWLIAEQIDFDWEAVVYDSLGPEPDLYFGPAAWSGGYGPSAARQVLRVSMSAYGTWSRARSKMLHFQGVDPGPATPWPGVIAVCNYGKQIGLEHLDGREVADRAALAALLAPFVPQAGTTAAIELSPADRQASLLRMIPYVATLAH